MLLVVRHAHAGSKHAWEGADGLRPLSPTGRAQADGLLVRLADYPIQRILCSPTTRCRQTVEPLARERRLPIEWSEALRVQSPPADALDLVGDPALRDVVLCTHGEVIARLFAHLAGNGLVTQDGLQWPKGSTWLLQRLAGGQVRARYLAPLSLGRPGRSGDSRPDPHGGFVRQ